MAGSRNEVETDQKHELHKASHGGDLDQEGQEVPEHPDIDDHDEEDDEESSSGANKQKDEDEVETVLLARHLPSEACSIHVQDNLMLLQGLQHVNSTSVLQNQHQWELEQKTTDDTKAPNVDKNP